MSISTPELTVDQLAGDLPHYTAVAGAPGTSTTELLAQFAARLARRSTGAPVIVLDPKGDACYMVARYVTPPPGVLMILSGEWTQGLSTALGVLHGAAAGGALLIDNAWTILKSADERDAFASYLRTLRGRDHRVVLQVHSPDDLPDMPAPELLCVFPVTPSATWSTAFPALAEAGVFSADQRATGSYERCVAVAADGAVRGAIDVGTEHYPEATRWRPEQA